jgi:twitching motility protein PilT
MQIGQSKFGMQTMNQSLCDLYIRKIVTLEDCLARSSELDELKQMILAGGGSLGSHAAPTPGRRS